MWSQIAVIVWAQWRTVRNHLPRAGFASLLGSAVSFIWYLFILSAATAIAIGLPSLPIGLIQTWLPTVLLALFVLWQVIPLFTLSTGWSLQLNKLQMYPIPNQALLGIEVILRITASPELILFLLGGTVGLLRHADLPTGAGIFLLLLLPINLLLSLAVREIVLHSFQRNRFREIFAVLLISIGVLPQILLGSGFGPRLQPYLERISRAPLTPWSAMANLALGRYHLVDPIAVLFWLGVSYLLASWLFNRSLRFEETAQSGSLAPHPTKAPALTPSRALQLDRFLPDPLGALFQKELQSLVRMPRFRIAFSMACIFGFVILLPMALRQEVRGTTFLAHNFLPIVTLYGVLILSDSLLLNVFGTDRSAAALYFVAPVPIRTVLLAKNLVAVFFLGVQSVAVLCIVAMVRRPLAPLDIFTAFGAVSVVGLFFLSTGNLTSILLARPSDPRQTMRKAAGGKLQLWLLLCLFGMAVLLGAAYLAQYALASPWGLFAVLGLEFSVGLIFYKVALDSAVEHAQRDVEKMIDALSKGSAIVGSHT